MTDNDVEQMILHQKQRSKHNTNRPTHCYEMSTRGTAAEQAGPRNASVPAIAVACIHKYARHCLYKIDEWHSAVTGDRRYSPLVLSRGANSMQNRRPARAFGVQRAVCRRTATQVRVLPRRGNGRVAIISSYVQRQRSPCRKAACVVDGFVLRQRVGVRSVAEMCPGESQAEM
jgi:hypothetical protein